MGRLGLRLVARSLLKPRARVRQQPRAAAEAVRVVAAPAPARVVEAAAAPVREAVAAVLEAAAPVPVREVAAPALAREAAATAPAQVAAAPAPAREAAAPAAAQVAQAPPPLCCQSRSHSGRCLGSCTSRQLPCTYRTAFPPAASSRPRGQWSHPCSHALAGAAWLLVPSERAESCEEDMHAERRWSGRVGARRLPSSTSSTRRRPARPPTQLPCPRSRVVCCAGRPQSRLSATYATRFPAAACRCPYSPPARRLQKATALRCSSRRSTVPRTFQPAEAAAQQARAAAVLAAAAVAVVLQLVRTMR